MQVSNYQVSNNIVDSESMYPSRQYTTRPQYALNFLIALDQRIETIVAYTKTLKEKNPDRLTHSDPGNSNLTPLHVAAIKSNKKAAEAIIAAIPSESVTKLLNAPDSYGWTPMHHAAVNSKSVFAYLRSLGGDSTLKTKGGADINDLLALSGNVIEIRSKKTLFIQEDLSIPPVLVSQCEKTKILGNILHTDSPLIPQHSLKKCGHSLAILATNHTKILEKIPQHL